MSYSAKRHKRMLAGVLAAAMALTVTPILGFTGTAGAAHLETADPVGEGNVCEGAPDEDPFVDVTEADPANEEIECMVNTEPQITQGTSATTYEPNSFITRRQMALFLQRVADLAEAQETSEDAIQELPADDNDSAFTDIDEEEADQQQAIRRLEDSGITQGVTATEFRPGDNVTRRQMANFIVRLQAFLAGEDFDPEPTNEGDDFFNDDDDEEEETENAFNTLAAEGVFIGTGGEGDEHNVSPGDDISRRQMAFVLTRKLEVLFEAGLIDRLFGDDGGVNPTATTRPELVSAAIVQTTSQGTTVRYTFDEALTGTGVNAALFHVYNFGSTGTPADSGDVAQVDNADTRSVLVTFQAITTAAGAGQLSVATVDEAAARSVSAASDTNIIGDAALNPGGTTQLTAGVTAAPDLVSVGNFRANPADVNETLVDFTFDEAAFNGATTGYHLINVDGVTDNSTGALVAGNGTTVHTVAFQNNPATPSTVTITAASIARGTVDTGTVGDATGGTGNVNPLQSADVSNSGNSETPDLVSALAVRNQPNPSPPPDNVDAILFTFDEPVLEPDVASEFVAYTSSGAEITGIAAQRSTTNDTQVAVVFGPAGTLDLVVGASVVDSAVNEGAGAQTRPNHQDEVPLANVGSGPTTTAGRTAGPDLISVDISERRDPFGTLIGARVTYGFDEDVVLADPTMLKVVLSDGTQFTCAGTTGAGTAATGTTEDTDHTVRCDDFGAAATTSQLLSAVVGVVDGGAVNNQATGGPSPPGTPGTETNPEGAEIASGSTGTPAS